MERPVQSFFQFLKQNLKNVELLDVKSGDVNGKGCLDTIKLYGLKLDDPSKNYAEGMTLIIIDGQTNFRTEMPLINAAGYNGRLFLGDFNYDSIPEILISVDAAENTGHGTFTIFSFKDNKLQELFNAQAYNSILTFHVEYEDNYAVRIENPQLGLLFTIDIRNKGPEYLSQYYKSDGILKLPLSGEVLPLGGLYPIVTNDSGYGFDLLASQQIIGTTSADTLGYVENVLTWDGIQFISKRLIVSSLNAEQKLSP